jgi:hypothetical protein
VVQALIESSKYPEYRDIFDSIRGAFFFGTPHQGLRTVELEDMAGDLEEGDGQQKVMNLLAQLREGSDYLYQQRSSLATMWQRFHGRVLTFYETERTSSVRRVSFSRPEIRAIPTSLSGRSYVDMYLKKC